MTFLLEYRLLNQAVHLLFVRGFSSVEEFKETVMCIAQNFFPKLYYFFSFFFSYLNNFIYLFYFGLCWVFIAVWAFV